MRRNLPHATGQEAGSIPKTTVPDRTTWIYTSGTGKLKGIQGKGTYEGTPNADGTVSHKADGEYRLP